ncbi:MAG: tripartite tricarboxylate transporter TctB family protein [Dethiosulfovibrio sp.]|nr:tripartite tricarboxylate transporter TctB family protein [Dethiosulfovibrio sp.]
MSRKQLNILCAAAGLVLAAAMFISVGYFPDRVVSAARYVLFLSGVMSVFSLLLLIQTLLVGTSEKLVWVKAPRPFFSTVALTVIYVISLDFVGFFPASGLYMIILGWILGFKRPVGLIGGSLVLLGTVYLVFVRFLSVPVPTGLLGG